MKKRKKNKKLLKSSLFSGLFLGFVISYLVIYTMNYTSTNEFCASCHVHPHVFDSWRQSTHFDNKAGMAVKCVDCHLPPEGIDYTYAKIVTGLRDVYGTIFKDSSDYNWKEKSQLEFAVKHVYKSGCLKCHTNLFPRQLSQKGGDAHVYYDQNKDKLRCINCHLHVGHYTDEELVIEEDIVSSEKYGSPAKVDSFISFSEQIPGSYISFNMIAVPGGEFIIGSPADEDFRDTDEGPQKKIKLSKFWISETEVTWNEYLQFMKETGGEGRTEDQLNAIRDEIKVDGITGPTPPYGNPGQGWGRGARPAITMTHYAAKVYCEWLSQKTGKKYRLPTEAEWEFACRGGTEGPYFFEGDPSDYSNKTFWNSLFGADTNTISSYAVYINNSGFETKKPSFVQANPFGIKNMLGNVKEFCSDYYSAETYENLSDGELDPKGPLSGTEYVTRGGSYKSDAAELRIANREMTNQAKWLMTDPQIPKSRWWYSDIREVGFRIVCEYSY